VGAFQGAQGLNLTRRSGARNFRLGRQNVRAISGLNGGGGSGGGGGGQQQQSSGGLRIINPDGTPATRFEGGQGRNPFSLPGQDLGRV